MKKSFLTVVFATLSVSSFAIFANTINFQGELTTNSCAVAINGAADPVVLLPSVPTAQLSAANNKAGKTDFTIAVTGCVATPAPKIRFVASNFSTAGNLVDPAKPTNPVKLQLLDTAGTAIALTGGIYTTPTAITLTGTPPNAAYTGTYGVQYFAETTGAAAGAINGSVQYSLAYQ
ncbi:type 1 fimbrial protein [Neisseriaceae bacterium TC5R-5]|nr:type 1 fimbrial protein [Neisseriaceae bacterium TC5R-5]